MSEPTTQPSIMYETVDQARVAHEALHSYWWGLYRANAKGSEEAISTAHKALVAHRRVVIAQFGKTNPKHPDCEQCREASVFGGPGHENSTYCRSGKRPHCSCDSCF